MNPIRPPRGREAMLLILAASCLTACAGAPPPVRREDLGVQLSPAEVADIRARLDRTEAMEREIAALRARSDDLEARLALAEARTGLAEFASPHLKRPPGAPPRIDPGKGLFVEGEGARPRKRRLAEHLEAYDGYVLAFWATWCVPCTTPEELGHLRRLRSGLRAQGFELVSLAVDDVGKVQGDRRAGTWLYPLWQKDDGHLDLLPREFIERVGVSLPLFLLVSRSGEVQYYRSAKLDDEVVRDIVTAMGLAGRL